MFFFQAEDGIRYLVRSRGLGDVYKRQHQIQAKPSLIAKARSADMVVCTGAELEVGWLPLLLQQSGNRKVQPGQPGNFAAADFVHKLDAVSYTHLTLPTSDLV